MKRLLIIIAAAVALGVQSAGIAAPNSADGHRVAMNQKIAAEGARLVVEMRSAELRRFNDEIAAVNRNYAALPLNERDAVRLEIADDYADRFAGYLAAYGGVKGRFVDVTERALKVVHEVEQQAAADLGRDDFAAVLQRHHLKAAAF